MTIKVQCPCGAKYALEITPVHLDQPIQLVCQYCHTDSSAAVNEIVRQQFGPASVPATSAPVMPAGLKVGSSAAEAKVSPSTPVAESFATCHRHADQVSTARCTVCKKPICPVCLSMFGYLCSTYCKAQAERERIDVPVYAFQKQAVEARFWQKVRRIALAVVLLAGTMVGAAVWYELFGSRPREVFAVKFTDENSDGFCRILAKDQVLVRQGNRLTRYDLKKRAEAWSIALFDPKQIEEAAKKHVQEDRVERERRRQQRARLKAAGRLGEEDENFAELRSRIEKPVSEAEEVAGSKEWMLESALNDLRFHFAGDDIWIIYTNKVARLQWRSGELDKEVPIPGAVDNFLVDQASLLFVSHGSNNVRLLTHILLPEGEVKSEEIASPQVATLASDKKLGTNLMTRTALAGRAGTNFSGAVVVQAKAGAKVAQVPAPIPRAMTAQIKPDYSGDEFMERRVFTAEGTNLVNAGENAAELRVELTEEKFVEYKTMKAKPQKSALDGDVNASATVAIANEIFNEWQEERTGGIKYEDESRYKVTVHRYLAKDAADWTGEVIGPPHLFALETVDLVVAGKGLIALDKRNQRRWDAKLNFPVSEEKFVDRARWNSEGEGRFIPCVEHKGVVYFYDPGMLTAFDAATGNVKWRLPSVGVSRVQFDAEGLMYVVTTSADPEQIKYSDQIDITRQTVPVLLKMDPRTGKVLWKLNRAGESCVLSGKFVYSVKSGYGESDPLRLGLGEPAHTKILRLNPRDGTTKWEHFHKQFAIDVAFQENTIQLLFPREMKVLRFLSL